MTSLHNAHSDRIVSARASGVIIIARARPLARMMIVWYERNIIWRNVTA